MITHLLFDLDNTLYSASNLMEQMISQRMFQFIAEFLAVSFEEAVRFQKLRRRYYGTTLEWLEAEHQLKDRDAYFAAVHPPAEIAELKPDPQLRDFLLSLQMPMTVLTNAPMAHADRVLRFLNIQDIFIGIFDISYHHGKGKPHPEAFTDTLAAVHKTVAETLFLDDCPAYTQGFTQLGGQSVLIDEKKRCTDFSKSSGIPVLTSIYDLPPLLQQLNTTAD